MSRHSNFGHSILLEACAGNVCVLLLPCGREPWSFKKEKKNIQRYLQATQSLSWFQSLIPLCDSVSKSQYGAVCVAVFIMACLRTCVRVLSPLCVCVCICLQVSGYVCLLLRTTKHLSIVTSILQSLAVNMAPLPLESSLPLW